MLRTRENSDVFNSLDEIYFVFTSKKQISSICFIRTGGNMVCMLGVRLSILFCTILNLPAFLPDLLDFRRL